MIDWASIPSVVIRTTVVFLFTFIMMRLRGKKQLAQLNIFDIIIIIALGSAVGDVMIYSEEVAPLFNSLTAIGTLVVLILIIENLLAIAPTKLIHFIEGKEELLVKDGVVDYKVLKKVNIHEEELKAKLRARGVHSYNELKAVYLEPDGAISIIFRKHFKKRKKPIHNGL